MKIIVYDTHDFEQSYLEKANNYQFEVKYLPIRLTKETVSLSKGADSIAIFGNDDASTEVIEQLHQNGIRFIALRSAGYNHVDVKKAKELGIKVANVPAYSPYSVAEHTITLIMALNRKLIKAHNRVRDLNFSLSGLVGFDMNGKTVGVIGTGKIGSVLTKILNGFGCKVLAYDKYPNEQLSQNYGVEYVSKEYLFQHSDVITLLVPLNPETKYIINKESIDMMKDGVMLINTSRGGLIDTKALIQALKTGKFHSVGLDVYELEQGLFHYDFSDTIVQDDMIARLLTFPNVLVTSHQAFLTSNAIENISESTFQSFYQWNTTGKADNELW
jgi:D-lactate dehydrogenase